MAVKTEKIGEIELKTLKNSKSAYEEIMVDSSKYYERFMEGWAFH